jgi:type II secretion system protein C
MVMPRVPLCSDVAAKIVSEQRTQQDSLASLSSAGERARVVRVGSRFGARQVVAISYDRGRMSPSVLVFGKDGVCQAMTFERATAASGNAPNSRRQGAKRNPSRHTEIVIERSAADAILERAFELTQSLRVAPDLKNGEVSGMRLLGVRPDSLAEKLGFENGDTIERVNGVALNSPEAALSLYANLHSLQRLDIQVSRAGKPASIEIRVN